ncbi:MAG: Gx transporter family protein [Erysipelotrichaceae bacterium]|nr:Gx transporter family protein [Erysipelotrichaceae bacterium]
MKTNQLTQIGFYIAMGVLLQILESFLPVMILIPGFKIGLANIVSLLALIQMDRKSMWIVGFSRVFLASLLQGTFLSVTFWLSVSGCLCSLCAMSLAFQTKRFSIYGISVAGAAMHHVGQVMAITFLYQQYYMQLYLPVLLALSVCSGLLMALFAEQIAKRIGKERVYD